MSERRHTRERGRRKKWRDAKTERGNEIGRQKRDDGWHKRRGCRQRERLCEKQKEERERVRDVNNAAERRERERERDGRRQRGGSGR